MFAGGLSVVRSELRSQGLSISGVKKWFDEMVSKVVTTLPGQEFHITGPKSFISDVDILKPCKHDLYLNGGLPLDNFLRRVRLEPGNVVMLGYSVQKDNIWYSQNQQATG